VEAAEHSRRGDRDLAARLQMLSGKREVCCLELGKDAAARLKIVPPRLGEREVARGAGHEAHPDLILERREMTADGRKRHVQAAPGGRKTPGVGDGDKDPHGGKAVHCIIPKSGNINWNNRQYSP
jgi:hypothetical protein